MYRDPVCGMEVDENNAFRLKSGSETYFFCSGHCLKKFAEERKIGQKEAAACTIRPKAPFYGNKTFIVTALLFLLILSSYILPFLEPFRQTLFVYVKAIWWAILLGLFLGGMIDYYVPREHISYLLAGRGKRTILYSVFLGFFMSACSHGILALSIELHKKGASNPAVVAFLLASPWANMTLTIMLVGFFGLKAFFIIISAVVIAAITGLIYQFLERKNLIEKNEKTMEMQSDFSIIGDIKKRISKYKFSFASIKSDIKGISRGMISLGDMTLWWVLIGMAIASLAGAYISPDIFKNYMGPTALGLIVTLALATIIEVCSEGSAPMAFEIFRQTRALGNSFVFLMAGVVTDYTEIGLLWHNVGKKVAIWLPIITVPQVLILGILANIIFK